MPLLWKTVKNATISQLVNDHLHRSRKRRDGSSLFVETGFPTSLVDLFIKNRDKYKLKKTSKKKRPTSATVDFTDPLITEIPTTPFDSPVISPVITGLPSRSQLISSTSVGCLDGLVEREVVHETGVDAITVLMVALKMFLVVVLALLTKKLTVGITISAFLLFFFEYVGKHAHPLLKPFSEVSGFLNLRVECVLRLLRFKEDLSKKNDPEGLIRAAGCEIQLVNEMNQDQFLCYQTGHGETEPDEVFVIGEGDPNSLMRKSRRAKIKSKMKKLVPKKLRCSRREQTSKKVDLVVEEEDHSRILLCDELVVQYEDERESDNGSSVLSSSSSRRYKEEESNNKTPSLGELSETGTTSDGIENWRYMVPCMIVLAGLIGGRAFAVILTLSWLLMLKLVDKLARVCVIRI